VVNLTFDEGGLRHLEGVKFGESGLKDSGVLVLEESLGLSGN
jgi:hypothetical protein